MIKTKKIISLIFLFLCITLIIADGSFSVINYSQINTCDTYPEISDHFEQAHFHGTEDCIALTENKIKTTQFLLKTYSNSTIEVGFKNKFISPIWQPPNIS